MYDTLDNIEKEISKYNFRWLGISVFSFMQKEDALNLVKDLKMYFMCSVLILNANSILHSRRRRICFT
ncbi:MAG: hypothetical protein CM15mV25_0580 [uncultured marine virus]|nr:MAG: hypothetical protein CM15mV25_0580 [uncultured marine virus]